MADIRRFLDSEYALKRDRAIYEAERRKRDVFEKIPELSRIETEITLTGVRYARSLISDADSANAISEYLEKMGRLNAEKEAILSKHNIPVNYLEPRFSCTICEDKGYISKDGASVPCSCYQKLYLEQLYKVSNLVDDEGTGFEFFDESFYSVTPDKKKYFTEISPRAQILAVKEQCLEFIDNFADNASHNLYFYGPTGTGKTFMAKSIGIEILKAGFTVLYLSATTLFPIIQQYRLNIDRDGVSSEQAYKNLITVNLLILDDLGTEPGSDSKYAELLSLLELRKAQGKNNIARTIISSNLDFKRLFQEYNERIASRIIGEFQALQFAGEDIRILKKLKR
ncbi:MAG: ATP-binding protein [Acetivibrionales bacterium]|jgi:DNA replication protein DnaC|nr:ATP-binding protein [Clostridiaceae bacterium]